MNLWDLQHLRMIGEAMVEAPAPVSILLTNGALLGMISVRNAHLSDRSRAIVDEYLYRLPTLTYSDKNCHDRANSLRSQCQNFNRRYEQSSLAFKLLTFTLISFLITFLLSVPYLTKSTNGASQILAGFFGLISFLIFTGGLGLFLNEFRKGPITLNMNKEALGYVLPQKPIS